MVDAPVAPDATLSAEWYRGSDDIEPIDKSSLSSATEYDSGCVVVGDPTDDDIDSFLGIELVL